MAQLQIQEAVNGLISISIKLILIFSLFLLSSNHQQYYNDVSCAPQATQHSPLVAKSAEKTADLSVLINETLTINNKTTSSSPSANPDELRPHNNNIALKDDWTFDMVEYDLMEFLQDLSARYRLANKNNTNESWSSSSSSSSSSPANEYETNGSLEGKSDGTKGPVNSTTTSATSKQKDHKLAQLPGTNKQEEQIATTLASNVKTNQSCSSSPIEEKVKIPLTNQQQAAILVTSELPPISLASGDDHDIAESTWQYGIFDRFTRPRASQTSTTTSSPPLEPLMAGGSNFDVRSFNSDECGLRTYEEEASFFPSGGFELQQEQQHQAEASKELNQRRQRPPVGSSFFSSHKKFQSSSLGGFDDTNSDTGDDDQQLVRRPIVPPFDSYGESTSAHHQHVALGADSVTANGEKQDSVSSTSGGTAGAAAAASPGDGEFNLSFRRQWLQQQLGHTLQMLGFNTSTQSAAEFLNQTSGLSLNFRENMMKKSNLNDINNQKAARSLDLTPDQKQQPEITEQELKARQDELKLEARVIGGSDARL